MNKKNDYLEYPTISSLDSKEVEKYNKYFKYRLSFTDLDSSNTDEYENDYLFQKILFRAGKYILLSLAVIGFVLFGNNSSIFLGEHTRYKEALNFLKSQEYSKASVIFNELAKDDYKDSKNLLDESVDNYIQELVKVNKYEEAIEWCKSLGISNNTRYKQLQYEYANSLMWKKDYKNAAHWYKSSRYSDSEEKYKNAIYKQAESEKDIEKAIKLFESISSYKDAQSCLDYLKYNYVEHHYYNTDKLTYEYLSDLMIKDYMNSKNYYNTLYSWKADVVVNDKEDDQLTDKTNLKNGTIVIHVFLNGGTPNEKVELSYRIDGPNAYVKVESWKEKLISGNVVTCGWYNGEKCEETGEYTISIFANNNLIATKKIKVTS